MLSREESDVGPLGELRSDRVPWVAHVEIGGQFSMDILGAGADPGFVVGGGGAAATASATGETLFGISKGGR